MVLLKAAGRTGAGRAAGHGVLGDLPGRVANWSADSTQHCGTHPCPDLYTRCRQRVYCRATDGVDRVHASTACGGGGVRGGSPAVGGGRQPGSQTGDSGSPHSGGPYRKDARFHHATGVRYGRIRQVGFVACQTALCGGGGWIGAGFHFVRIPVGYYSPSAAGGNGDGRKRTSYDPVESAGPGRY